jgi:regulator of RNase E activity RraA
MNNAVVTGCPRADLGEVGALARFGVATVHEAMGRTGYLGPGIRPVHLGSRIGGTAVTVVCWPGDNLGLDRYGLRSVLSERGVQYVDYQSYQEAGP